MRGRRLFSLAAAMGLVLSLVAGTALTTSAEEAGRSDLGYNALYLPWVHNGDDLDGAGPWFGTVTVQNLEDAAIVAVITTASGNSTAFNLNAHASKTFTAAQLGVAEGGEGVVVNANWNAGTPVCRSGPVDLTHGAAGAVDTFDVADAFGDGYVLSSVDRVYDDETEFPASSYLPGGIGTETGAINWSPSGAEPGTGDGYTANVTACLRLPWIGAVEKHMMPELGNSAQTSSAQTAVDGYTALGSLDIPWFPVPVGVFGSYLPIVQTNSGWNSIIHATNFGADNAGVTMTFYAAAGQGAAGPSFGPFTQTLKTGETWTFDLSASGVPDGWVGGVFISADDPEIVTQVDRVKPSTSMAMTNVAAPFFGEGVSADEMYAPLVFKDYNGWNTGINITNLMAFDNTVEITYYGQNGNVVGQEQLTIPIRGMEYVYLPAVGDIGLGPASVSSAVISGTAPFHVAVDEVKYTGKTSEGAGHAMSYIATAQGAFKGAQLSLPLVQKGNLDGNGDTSGLNLFNPDPDYSATGLLWFFDSSGAPVAPTLNKPLQLTLSAFQSATVYSMNYSEMPQGFQGSALLAVVDGDGQIVGVSNNVNYAVDGDGSAVFTMLSTCGNFSLGCTPDGGSGVGHDFLVTPDTQSLTTDESPAEILVFVYDQLDLPVPGIDVEATVVSGPNQGKVYAGVTDLLGSVALEDAYDGSNGPGTDDLSIWVDMDHDGQIDPDETATASVSWVVP